MTDRNLPEKPQRSRIPDPQQALNELAACVERYRAHNDRFERALTERHTRWESEGLFRPERADRGRFERSLNERDEQRRERTRERLVGLRIK